MKDRALRRRSTMKKVRLADIAREAQVGTATVERVLNARGNVSPTAIDKVIQAARRLGYKNPLPERYRGVLRIEVIMVRRETPFFYRLASAFQRISESLDASPSAEPSCQMPNHLSNGINPSP